MMLQLRLCKPISVYANSKTEKIPSEEEMLPLKAHVSVVMASSRKYVLNVRLEIYVLILYQGFFFLYMTPLKLYHSIINLI